MAAPIGVAVPSMRQRMCSVFVIGALALENLFAIEPMAVAAEARVSHCVAPADLSRLDLPLSGTARHSCERANASRNCFNNFSKCRSLLD